MSTPTHEVKEAKPERRRGSPGPVTGGTEAGKLGPLEPSSLLRLQRSAGNAAVTAAVRRSATAKPKPKPLSAARAAAAEATAVREAPAEEKTEAPPVEHRDKELAPAPPGEGNGAGPPSDPPAGKPGEGGPGAGNQAVAGLLGVARAVRAGVEAVGADLGSRVGGLAKTATTILPAKGGRVQRSPTTAPDVRRPPKPVAGPKPAPGGGKAPGPVGAGDVAASGGPGALHQGTPATPGAGGVSSATPPTGAGGGGDVIFGGQGHDVLLPGPGKDKAVGGPGNDVIDGGRGNDVLVDGSDNGGGGDAPVTGGAGGGNAPTGGHAAPAKGGHAPKGGGGPAGAHAPGQAPGGAGGGTAPTGGHRPKKPEQDPRFQALKGKVKQAGATSKQHAAPAAKVAEAHGAAAGPTNEVAAQAGAAQVEKMGAQQPGGFNKQAFIDAVKAAVEASSPTSLEEADDFAKSGKAGEVKGKVSDIVKGDKKESEKAIKDTTEEAPDTSNARPKEVTPLPTEQPGAPPPKPDAAAGMPAPAAPAETSLQQGKVELAGQMQEASITEDQLKKANEPSFDGALKAKKEAEKHADTAPQNYRKQEQDILKKAHSEAEAKTGQGLGAMHDTRGKALGQVQGGKEGTKSNDEQERANVSKRLEEIYKKTKDEVGKILADLDGLVDKAFEEGERGARKAFEDHVAREMDAFKERRYGGITGAGQWLIDKVMGPPAEVNGFFAAGKEVYLREMNGVISHVADVVGEQLTAAKARIAQGRAESTKYVAELAPSLQKIGAEAQEKISAQFDQLDQDVDAKQDELVQSLAQKYVESRDAIDKRIDEMKAANEGLVDKAKNAIGGVVQTILKLKDMLLNVLKKAEDAIGKIIKDPIGFLKNLLSAIKEGLSRFVSNIWEHLKKGLLGWLFGALGDAGISMPKSFDLKGIFTLVMEVLGLTWTSIRQIAVKKIGEPMMAKMEKGVEIFQKLVSEGPMGIWHMIVDKVSSLWDNVLDMVKDWVVTKVIQSAVTKLVTMFNPVGAFIQACMAIYNTVMFFIERASQLGEFVNTIVESVSAIANGAIGGAAGWIENALSKSLPLIISFLARLVGLGGISDKIKEFLEKIRKPIRTVVEKVVDAGIKIGKKALGFVGKSVAYVKAKGKQALDYGKKKVAQGKAYVKKKYEQGKTFVKKKVGQGKAAVKKKVTAGLEWLQEKLGIKVSKPVTVGGQAHTLTAVVEFESVEILMASTPEPIVRKLKKAKDTEPKKNHPPIDAAITKATDIMSQLSKDARQKKKELKDLVAAKKARGWRSDFRRAREQLRQVAMTKLAEIIGPLSHIATLGKIGGDRLAQIDGDIAEQVKRQDELEKGVLAIKNSPRFKPGDTSERIASSGKLVAPSERAALRGIGKDKCHQKNSGLGPCSKGQNYTPDHQPVSELMTIQFKGKPLVKKTTQYLYPQCAAHSDQQGGAVMQLRRKIKEYDLCVKKIKELKKEKAAYK